MSEYKLYEEVILDATHTLIGGCSGSGKSVAINSIIYYALTHPSEKAFVMIDLKRVELSAYRGIPHTLYYADSLSQARYALEASVDILRHLNATLHIDVNT